MTDTFDSTEWITTDEAAELTGYSVQYVRRLLRKDRVHAKKWMRDWMVDKKDILAYQRSMQSLGQKRYDPWRTGAREKNQDD